MWDAVGYAMEVKERKADDRGRVALGPEFAGKTVEVVVEAIEEHDGEQSAN